MMKFEHAGLAAGRWRTLTFMEQMGNIGGEVERAFNWRKKGNLDQSVRAFHRALELTDLTLADPRNLRRAKELARGREVLVDFFYGSNEYGSTDDLVRRYYLAFAYAARRHR